MSRLLRTLGAQSPRTADTAFIAENAAVIGDVVVGERSSLWYGVILRGDVNVIRVGKFTNLQDGTVVHCNHGGQGTWIGDHVTVGHMALLHDCTLEDRAFVGMRAVVMDGAVVEGGAMVAAGALVTPGKRVKTGELWGGSPARKMRDLSEEEAAHIDWTSVHYARLAAKYLEIDEP